MYTNVRSTPSPHPQAYPADLRSGVMVAAGTVYGPPGMPHHPQMPQFQHGGRGGRRGNVTADHRVAIRSPLLDEFRANKSRKWELKVLRLSTLLGVTADLLVVGHLRLHCGVQRRSAWLAVYTTEGRDSEYRREAEDLRGDCAYSCSATHPGRLWELCMCATISIQYMD